jgi:LacI family transcriptional regulator
MPSKLVRQVESILIDRMADLPANQPLPREVILAKQIGVSRRTLRKALADLETNERVRRIKGKGTFPTRGHQAIPIFQRRARMIALVASRPFSRPYRRLITTGAFGESSRRGYNLVLVKKDTKENVFQVSDDPHVDGVILYQYRDDGLIEALLKRGKPICLVDHYHPKVDSVETDSRKGMILAVRHLYQLGHRRIAFIDSADPERNPERSKGYDIAFQQLKMFRRPDWIVKKPLTIEGGVAGARILLSLPISKRPTAIIAFSVRASLGAAKEILRRGLEIPRDISLLSTGGTQHQERKGASVKGVPKLTHVTVNPRELGKAAINNLIERIKNQKLLPQNTLIPMKLEINETTGKIE